MHEDVRAQDGQVFAELRDYARQLAEQLPGPLQRIRLSSGSALVEVEWQPFATGIPLPPQSANGSLAPAGADAPAEAGAPERDTHGDNVITSPMVGTFYRAPEPGAEPFVSVGDEVTSGQVIGIVEAMKLMNPIVSEVSGLVIELHAEDAEAVEFGQPLLTLAAVSGSGTA
jgi:acetyl-CoA carboxylase biotin carboxyl carrier protein